MQWSVQGVSVVYSLSLRPAGKARLTKPDWHCQELCEQRDWIYITAQSSFVKCFLWGNPFHSNCGGQRSKPEAGRKALQLQCRQSKLMETKTDGAFSFLLTRKNQFITRKLFSNSQQSVNTSDNLWQDPGCQSLQYEPWLFTWWTTVKQCAEFLVYTVGRKHHKCSEHSHCSRSLILVGDHSIFSWKYTLIWSKCFKLKPRIRSLKSTSHMRMFCTTFLSITVKITSSLMTWQC